MKLCRQLLSAVIVIALAVSPAFAQGTTTSAITGTVTDSGGGVIPGATVNVTSDAGVKADVVSKNANVRYGEPRLTGWGRVPPLTSGSFAEI